MDENKYSVLMSVYHKENPNYLIESINSMLKQSVKPDEIVLVKDGELTPELEEALNTFDEEKILKIIELKENVGLGKALSIGIQACKNELVARMDTDDIATETRCEKQLQFFSTDKELCVVGSSVAEFINDATNIISIKDVKIEHQQIVRQMKYRNPMSHPSVMIKKSKVISVGNYQDWFLNEDYYLWIRMMQKGYKFKNINEPLVKMRISNDTYLRRGGWKYYITQKKLFDYMYNEKIINIFEYCFNNSVRLVARILIPNELRKKLYINILRKKIRE